MKHKQFFQNHNQTPVSVPPPVVAIDLHLEGKDMGPSREEVARRAYFRYVHHGSQPGHDLRNWLEAEAQLLREHRDAK